jgi:hypothetical protein
VIEAIFRVIFGLLFAIICWLVFIPIVLALATPVIFFIILFKREGTFIGNVKDEYLRTWKFWMKWGVFFVPPF